MRHRCIQEVKNGKRQWDKSQHIRLTLQTVEMGPLPGSIYVCNSVRLTKCTFHLFVAYFQFVVLF